MSDTQEFNDMYPRDGEYFQPVRELPEQKREESEEKAKVLAGMKLLEDMIDKLDSEIKVLDSLASIPKTVRMKPEELALAFNANLAASVSLAKIKDHFEGLKEQYKP